MFAEKNKPIIVIVVTIAALMLASLACGSSSEPELVATAPPADDSVDTPDEQAEVDTVDEEPIDEVADEEEILEGYQIGDIITLRNSTIMVLGWEIVPGSQFFEPDPGNMWVAVDLIIVNSGDSPTVISSYLQTSVKDETFQIYNVDIMSTSEVKGGSIDGELSPGERVRGKVSFEVPEDVESLEFIFDAEVFRSGKVFVDLGSEPVMFDPPDEIPGETEQLTYNMGDTVEIDNLSVTINDVSLPPGDQFNRPSEGYKFILVDLTIQNNADYSVNVSSLLQMWVKDSTGQKFTIDIFATTAGGGTTPDAEFTPGEIIRGQVGYEVPEDETSLVFVFDGDAFGTGKIFFDISLD